MLLPPLSLAKSQASTVTSKGQTASSASGCSCLQQARLPQNHLDTCCILSVPLLSLARAKLQILLCSSCTSAAGSSCRKPKLPRLSLARAKQPLLPLTVLAVCPSCTSASGSSCGMPKLPPSFIFGKNQSSTALARAQQPLLALAVLACSKPGCNIIT
jgi:hypothetical protein